MSKSELFSTLPDINFAEKDPDVIESEVISLLEEKQGRSLAQGDPLRVFADSWILSIIQHRHLINYTAQQNSLAYSGGKFLDHLGAFYGVSRLPAASASCTLEFSLSAIRDFAVTIPSNTRATPGDNIYFAVAESVEIPAGESSITVEAFCTETGSKGNGYVIGQINKIVDVFPYEMSVRNITASSGGSEIENDENFRERIMIAPESFTTAGSAGAYRYYTKTAHNDIIDAAVLTPPDTEPGHVKIIPLMKNGELPSPEILQAVYDTCNAEDVRPDTDYLTVEAPEEFFYDLDAYYWIDKKNSAQSANIQKNITNAVEKFILWQRLALGRDLNPSELIRRIIDAGAKRCEIISPVFTALKKNQLAVLNLKHLVYSGLEEG